MFPISEPSLVENGRKWRNKKRKKKMARAMNKTKRKEKKDTAGMSRSNPNKDVVLFAPAVDEVEWDILKLWESPGNINVGIVTLSELLEGVSGSGGEGGAINFVVEDGVDEFDKEGGGVDGEEGWSLCSGGVGGGGAEIFRGWDEIEEEEGEGDAGGGGMGADDSSIDTVTVCVIYMYNTRLNINEYRWNTDERTSYTTRNSKDIKINILFAHKI